MKIAWLTPYGSDKLWDPSIRLRRWNVHNELFNMGIDSQFFWECENAPNLFDRLKDFDVVVHTEHTEYLLSLMEQLKAQGVKQVRDHCELLFGFPLQQESFVLMDKIICSSELIADVTRGNGFGAHSAIAVIEDMWEKSMIQIPKEKEDGLSAVFMGTGDSLTYTEEHLRPLLQSKGYSLTVISNDPNKGHLWDQNTWAGFYSGHDIAICPQVMVDFPGKSSVKLAQALSFGYPTISTPIRSYKELTERSKCGLLASTTDEWVGALNLMRSYAYRKSAHKNALRISGDYSPRSIALKWYMELLS